MSAQTDKARAALALISTAADRGFTLDYAMGIAQAALSELEAQPSEPRLTVDQIMEVVKEWVLDWCDWSVIASDDGKDLRDRLTKAAQP